VQFDARAPEYVPAGQVEQVEVHRLLEYVPAGQSTPRHQHGLEASEDN